MNINKTLEQHIAVFGESGSGKTVMLSSFYGATQEPEFSKNHLYRVIADDAGQGTALHQMYLGMRRSGVLPNANRFKSNSYSFSVKVKESNSGPADNASPFNAVKLVWHDYPGEWFQSSVENKVEHQRKVDTFKTLLGSDVALLLVDAQLLIDNAGEEERYLKSLISNYKNGILSIQDDLIEDGRKLIKFPRIWMFALSKSDLLPEYDVYEFRDLMIAKVAGEIDELRSVLKDVIVADSALSVGEDFALMSSAKFEAEKIEFTERVGIDLILPIATVVPFQRHIRWARAKELPNVVVKELLGGAGGIAKLLQMNKNRFPGPIQGLIGIINPVAIEQVAGLFGDKLQKLHEKSLERKNYLAAIISGYQIALEEAEKNRKLKRSER